MFHYDVMTAQEAEAERFSLIKDGIYEGVITSSSDKQSSKGNPMMDITITVWDEAGKEHAIRDFLVFSKGMMWKVIKFAESAGLSNEYLSGQLCSEKAINKRVVVKIAQEEGREIPADKLQGKLPGSKYPAKNVIQDYLPGKPFDESSNVLVDDEIPFL